MSSRLFQKVREENGLCYSIYSYTASFPQAGMAGIYAGLSDNALEKAIGMIDSEIARICNEKVSDYELNKARSQIKCGIVMSRESVGSHMAENGKSLLLTDRVRTDDEILKAVLSVTEEDILNVANEILGVKERTIFILDNK